MSRFATEIMTDWIRRLEIDDVKTIFTACKDRLKVIQEGIDQETFEGLVDGLKRCEPGDKLYLMRPWLYQSTQHEALRFWTYQKRARRLWFDTPGNKGRISFFGEGAIKMYQPSRCQADVRLRVQERNNAR